MKKNFKLFVSLLVTVFVLSIVGNTAFAAGNYDNIADGDHSIGITSLESGGTAVSGADNFIHDPSLTIKDGNATLTLEVGAGGGAFAEFDFSIDWVTVGGKAPISEREDGDSTYFTFQLDEVKTSIPAGMKYVVPGVFPDGHEVDFDLELSGLDALPVKDDATEEPTEEDNNNNGAENEDEEETETPVEEEDVVVEDEEEGTEESVEDNTATETEEEDTEAAVEENTTVDNNDSNGAVETADGEEAETNPQTGDTNNIWLYVLLLMGAAVPLVIKFKKHFA